MKNPSIDKAVRNVLGLTAGLAASAAMTGAASATMAETDRAAFEQKVMDAMEQCETVAETCAANMENAAGVLVFPEVIKASLGVGGSGAQGALVVDGEIQGMYDLASASLGLQAGVDEVTQTIVFRSEEALQSFQDSPEWEIGADANVTVINVGANADTMSGGEEDPVVSYVYEQDGLAAGVSLEGTLITADDGDEALDEDMKDGDGM